MQRAGRGLVVPEAQAQALQLAWDSVSLGALKTCPRFYELRILHGWVSRAAKVDLEFGIAYHTGREKYWHAKERGVSHADALDETVEWALEETWDAALGRPRFPFGYDVNKNRYTLIRTLVWYLDQFEHDPFRTIRLANGQPAVELSFHFDLDLPSAFSLCGRIDRLAELDGLVFILDAKTTKHTLNSSYFANFSPDNQMSLYDVAGKVVWKQPIQGVIVDAAQVGVKFSRFQRSVVSRTEAQREEWLADTRVWLTLAEGFARRAHWPQNDKACFRCDFREVCALPPSLRESALRQGFTKRMWNPLKREG